MAGPIMGRPIMTLTQNTIFTAALRRGALYGIAWGATLAAGLTGLTLAQCGAVCLDQTATLAALSVAAGVACFAPLTAFAARTR